MASLSPKKRFTVDFEEDEDGGAVIQVTGKAIPPKPRRKIKTGTPKVPAPSKPHCPTHKTEMFFNTDKMVWSCIKVECGMVAFPKQELDSGKPIVGTGELELVVIRDEYGENKVFLKATATNIMVEVTNYMASPEDAGKSNALHVDRYDVSLILDKGSMFDHHGRPLG